MDPRRLRAPVHDGGLLAQPPLGEAADCLARNVGLLAGWDHDFQGRRAGRLRAMARREVAAASHRFHEELGLDPVDLGPGAENLVVTGHQPELFHPGVWVKNFVTSALARKNQGHALNLVVDDDLPKSSSIRVPTREGNRLKVVSVPFDDRAGDAPYEDWNVRDEAIFRDFGPRVAEVLDPSVPDPIIREFWPFAELASARTDRVGARIVAARHAVEVAWGVRNAEVPLGRACETEAFGWFASHLLAHLPRFQEVHNVALSRYRRLYGIRSRNHPVPALKVEGEWREAPFWVWRAESARRRPLLARQLSSRMELRIPGEDEPFIELPLAPEREACCAVDELATLPGRGIRIRTRALTTTMFSRLLLGHLFVHGIGGAKYDELGDEIVRRFFGMEPPSYLTITLTKHLGLPGRPATGERLRELDRLGRDLVFNPDRHLSDPSGELAELVAAKHRAIAGPVATHRDRVARFHEIRRLNARLAEVVADRRAAVLTERESVQLDLRQNRLAWSREYPFVLHSARQLRETFDQVRQAVLLA